MDAKLNSIRTQYLTLERDDDRKKAALDLCERLSREPELSLEQVTLLLHMTIDTVDEAGAIDPKLERRVREVFLAKTMSESSIAAFRDQLFAKHTKNVTPDELQAAYKALGGDDRELDVQAIQKLFALAASEGELTSEERSELRNIRDKARITPRGKSQFAKEMLLGLLDTLSKPEASILTEDVAQDLKDSLKDKESKKLIGAVDTLFFHTPMSDRARESFRDVYKDAPGLTGTELLLALKQLKSPSGKIEAAELKKLILRMGAGDRLTPEQRATLQDLERAPLSDDARLLLNEWTGRRSSTGPRAASLDAPPNLPNDLVDSLFAVKMRGSIKALARATREPERIAMIGSALRVLDRLRQAGAIPMPIGPERSARLIDVFRSDPSTHPNRLALQVFMAAAGIETELEAYLEGRKKDLPLDGGLLAGRDVPKDIRCPSSTDRLLAFRSDSEHGTDYHLIDRADATVSVLSSANRADGVERGATPIVFGDSLYLVGGIEERADRPTVVTYDRKRRALEPVPGLAWRFGAAAIGHEGALYVLGGYDRAEGGQQRRSDGVVRLAKNKKWIDCPKLPIEMVGAQGCSTSDGRLALVSGQSACIYDPNGKRSEQLPRLPIQYVGEGTDVTSVRMVGTKLYASARMARAEKGGHTVLSLDLGALPQAAWQLESEKKPQLLFTQDGVWTRYNKGELREVGLKAQQLLAPPAPALVPAPGEQKIMPLSMAASTAASMDAPQSDGPKDATPAIERVKRSRNIEPLIEHAIQAMHEAPRVFEVDDVVDLLRALEIANSDDALTPAIQDQVNELFFSADLTDEAADAFGKKWFEAGLSGITDSALLKLPALRPPNEGVPSRADALRAICASRIVPDSLQLLLKSGVLGALDKEDERSLSGPLFGMFEREVRRLVESNNIDRFDAELMIAFADELRGVAPDLGKNLDEQLKRLLLLTNHSGGSEEVLRAEIGNRVEFSLFEVQCADALGKAGSLRRSAIESGASTTQKEIAKPAMPAIRRVTEDSNQGEALLHSLLDTLHPKMSSALEDAGYRFIVARQNGSKKPNEPKDLDRSGMDRTIEVRAYFREGQLRIDTPSVFREIGRAIDRTICASEKGPWHIQGPLADAFIKENGSLPAERKTQDEYVPEIVAAYLLDPTECQRRFPLGFVEIDNVLQSQEPDHRAIAEFERGLDPKAVVNIRKESGDPRRDLSQNELLNRNRKDDQHATQAYAITLSGDLDLGAPLLAAELARRLRWERTSSSARPSMDGALVRIDGATFNSPGSLKQLLDGEARSGQGALLYVDELESIPSGSLGFKTLEGHFARTGDLTPIVFAGQPSEIKRLKHELSTVIRSTYELDALQPTDQAEIVARLARDEGFEIEQPAIRAIAAIAHGGGYQATKEIWRLVKAAQHARLTSSVDRGPMHRSRGNFITPSDVARVKIPAKRTPLEKIRRMIGQDPAKRELTSVLGAIKVARVQSKEGVEEPRPRLNLLFSGDQGTGKTTMAKLFVEELHRIGYLKSSQIKAVKIQDLLNGGRPEEAVKRLFESNKGGAIFIDELHQLQYTDEGRRAFRAMIPYLGDDEYADTVFIGAGYKGELRDLVRDLDRGGERRFTEVPFSSFDAAQLEQILGNKAEERSIVLSPEARAAALERIEAERRKMKHFGNGGTVETVLEGAIKKRNRRLADIDEADIKPEDIALLPEDFARDDRVSKEELWAEIDALEGLEGVKEKFRELAALVEFARSTGGDPFAYFEPYFLVEDPSGDAKTVATLLGRFGAAYDLLASPEVVEKHGAALQGRFAGQTTGDVEKVFEGAWGRLLFIDKVGGLAKSGGDFKEDAVREILTQIKNYRGRFMMAVADDREALDEFLALDAGLARAFGNRMTCAPMTAEEAVRDLMKRLAAPPSNFDTKGVNAVIAEHMKALAEHPKWASASDVEKLKNKIVAKQARIFAARIKLGAIDPKVILPEAVADAFAELGAEKKAQASFVPKARPKASLHAVDTQTAVRTEELREVEVEVLTEEDHALMAHMHDVDAEFAHVFNAQPLEQAKQEADVNSAYVRRIAEKAGIAPELVVQRLKKVKVKVQRLAMTERVVEHFKYDCPFCKKVESATCKYMDRPIEWKIMHSRQKPWTEIQRTSRMVEDVREEDRLVQERITAS